MAKHRKGEPPDEPLGKRVREVEKGRGDADGWEEDRETIPQDGKKPDGVEVWKMGKR